MRFGLLLSLLLACRAVAASQAGAFEDGRHDVAALERSLHSRNLADNIWNAIKNAASCTGCQGILFLLKGLALLGDRAFVDSIQEICKLAKIQDADVCDGAVALEGPIIANVIRHMDLNSPTSERFCATVFGLCQLPSPQPWSVPFPSPKPAITQPTSNRGTPLKVVHYSDIHLDIDYLPGSNTQCTKPICCRAYQPSDSPGNTSNPAGLYGDHKCDPPATLEESMFRAIRDAVPDMSFALFTGDIVAGYIWNTSESYNSASITNGYSPMENYVNIVYGTVGNHEQSPVNAFQPQSVGTNAAWIYDLLSSIWTRWTGSQTANTISQIGAYSTKVPGRNLRIISINTNLYYKMNFWMYQRKMEVDPDGQFTWLVGELDAAEKAGERVYIIGHMPMGTSDAFYDASNYFDQITNRYAGTIAGMFFGHTHADQFQISYANYSDQSFSNAVAMSYIAPSVTPTSGMPAFRVYSVDPDTFGVLDVVQYMADMTNPAFQTTGPVWTEYYSAKDVYGPIVQPPVTDASTELTPAFWHNVTAAFQTNATLFNAYMARKSRGWKAATCTGDCQASEICQLRAARSQDNCVKPVPGVHLNKRNNDKIDSDHATDCGFSMIGHILGSVGQSKIALDALQEKFVIQKGMT